MNLTLNGADLARGTGVDGIEFYGRIHGVIVRDVAIFKFPNHAITTSYNDPLDGGPRSAYSCRFERIAAKACGGISYSFNNTTDTQFTDLECIEGGSTGFFIAGCGNSCFTNCRAEWNKYNGYDLRGGNGIIELLACSTDSNGFNGVNIDANSNVDGLIILNGLRLNRDGLNGGNAGGGYAGLRVSGAKTSVIVTALGVKVGIGDDGLGPNRPQYGASIDNATCVVVDSGLVHGVTAGWRDGGGNKTLRKGANLIEQAGGII